MIKLLLNPSFRIACRDDAVILLSEQGYVELPRAYLDLLQRLQRPTDIDDIGENEQAALLHLGKLKLIVNANFRGLAPEVAAYWLARSFSLKYVEAQLNLGIHFVGPYAATYRELFSFSYPECRIGDIDAALLVCVTDDLQGQGNPDYAGRPQVMIKVGGIRQLIGPVLSPVFTLSDFRLALPQPFGVDLSVFVPAGLQATADAILLSELYHLRVEAGAHAATNHVVEWNLSRMKKRVLKVKP